MGSEISEGQLRRALSALVKDSAPGALDEIYLKLEDPLPVQCREAQNSLRAATSSAMDALYLGSLGNRVLKTLAAKSTRGAWDPAAQDCLRSSLLFACAGVDRTLKRLVVDCMAPLIGSDQVVQKKFQDFAQKAVTSVDGGVDPKKLVAILLSEGRTPKEMLVQNWIYSLTADSAQSAERVDELSGALGVVEPKLRRLMKPTSDKSSRLEEAFSARNQIAHELDVTDPQADVRRPLERIRRARSVKEVEMYVGDVLKIALGVTQDVAKRLT